MSTPPTEYGSNGPHSRDPEAIARAISETRNDVDETLDALQARLSPGQLLDRAMELMRANGGQFASNLGRSVRDNPLPVMLTGIGLAWMIVGSGTLSAAEGGTSPRVRPSGRRGDARLSGAASDALSAAGTRIAGAAEFATEAVSNAADKVSDELADARDVVTDQSRRVSEGFTNLLRDQPLVVGAVGIALGALVGYALPASDVEDRVLGAASDATTRRVAEGTKAQLAEAQEAVSGRVSSDNYSMRETAGTSQGERSDHEAPGSASARNR